MDSKSLTTKEVARLCHVSDATVKRWEEAGLIQSERTNGGHRRFRAEEVARFQHKSGLGLKTCHGDESVTVATSRRRPSNAYSSCSFFKAIVAGCEDEAANILINNFLQEKLPPSLFDNLISQALYRVGELWYSGELSVTQEHLATRSTVLALHKLRNVLPVSKSNGRLVMCCAMEGDFHELPTYMAQIILEDCGYEVINFGANTPLYSLAEEVLHYSPAIVCIAATVMDNLERSCRDYKDFRGQISNVKTSVVLGGRFFKEQDMIHRFPAELYAKSFTALSDFARKISEEK